MEPTNFHLDEENIYQPNGKAEPLPLFTKPVKRARTLKKRAIVVLFSGLTLIVGFVALHALQGREYQAPAYQQKAFDALPNEAVRALPSDYSKVKKPQGPPEIRAKLKEPVVVEDLEAKYRAEMQAKRLKRLQEARDSEIEFAGVKLPSGDGGSSTHLRGGGLPGSIEAAALTNTSIPGSDRDQANRQDDKASFLNARRDDAFLLREGLQEPASPYLLSAGTIIPGLMITGVNSDLPGQILGQISQNIYDSKSGNYLLLPQGTKIIGSYDSRVTYGQERVLIVWTRLTLPNGKSISLEGMPGVDLSGYAGLSDKVDNHYFKLATGVLFGSLLGAGAQLAQGSNRTVDPSYGQLALEGVAENTNEVGQELTRKNLEIQPTLKITPGFRFNVFVTKDVVLEVFEG